MAHHQRILRRVLPGSAGRDAEAGCREVGQSGRRQEDDMEALALRLFPKASDEALAEFKTLTSISLFCFIGLLGICERYRARQVHSG
jgi:hypothetical protein